MGKKLSEEQKAKMKAGREAARQRKLAEQAPPLNPPVEESKKILVDEDTIVKLMREVEELKAANPNVKVTPEAAVATLSQMDGAQLNNRGVQGRVFKYPVEKSYYPDPTERLYDDERLKRFAMRENFYFKWDVTGETYESNGITFTEPRFTVELYRYILDEDGNRTGKMILVNRQMQHEDEFIARVAADKLGVKFDTHEELLNEMRYYRIRQWLLGVFAPPKINEYRKRQNTMVVDGKVVEVFDTEEQVAAEMGNAEADTIRYQTQIRN